MYICTYVHIYFHVNSAALGTDKKKGSFSIYIGICTYHAYQRLHLVFHFFQKKDTITLRSVITGHRQIFRTILSQRVRHDNFTKIDQTAPLTD
jgi:hypothetical protein